MAYYRENQRISSTEVLQEIANDQEIRLSKCTISGSLDINRLLVEGEHFGLSRLDYDRDEEKGTIRLHHMIRFNSCTFEDDVFFAPPWETPESLEVIFYKEIAFNSSTFRGQARFSRSVFYEMAGFDGCTFERIATFRNAVFHGNVMFRTVAFDGYGLFNDVLFNREARFTNTYFSKGGNFTNVVFNDRTDFAGVYSKSKAVPVYESVKFNRRIYGDDETFWRFIKQASQEAGYYQHAGESFYFERCAHLNRKFFGIDYDNLSGWKRFFRLLWGVRLLPELIFGRLLFGYGERPIRVLVASAIVIFVCALFHASPSADIVNRNVVGLNFHAIMDGLYFSTITFTTLGFGDLHPAPTHMPTKMVAMIEAIAGAFLMALFVVSLSKRFSRG